MNGELFEQFTPGTCAVFPPNDTAGTVYAKLSLVVSALVFPPGTPVFFYWYCRKTV